MSDKIITPPSTPAYREGWDRVFGDKFHKTPDCDHLLSDKTFSEIINNFFEATRKAYPDIPFTREQFDHATEVKNMLIGKSE